MLAKKELLNLYTDMIRIRVCEESLIEYILSGEIRCPVHLCSGQEGVAVGVCATLNQNDVVFGNHRSHGHYLAKGGDLIGMVSEIFCRESGCAKGRGGSMHLVAPSVSFMGSAPIVAGTVSLAVGAALKMKINKEKNVAVAFFGDGAVGEGVVYESLNFASLYKLPVLFVCENNLYATHLPINKCRVSYDIAPIAVPFDILNYIVDGNNVLEVYESSLKLVNRCREGGGPAFLECKTYRLRGHVGPDDNIQGLHTDIRPKEEVEYWKNRDPIIFFRQYLLREEGLTEDELDAIVKMAKEEVEEAITIARKTPFPDKRGLKENVFS